MSEKFPMPMEMPKMEPGFDPNHAKNEALLETEKAAKDHLEHIAHERESLIGAIEEMERHFDDMSDTPEMNVLRLQLNASRSNLDKLDMMEAKTRSNLVRIKRELGLN